MKAIHILFTGVGRRIELIQAFRNAALVLGKNLKIYGTDVSNTAPALAYCDFIRKIVPMRSSDYIQNLLEICKKDYIDLVIPTIDTDLLVLSENKERFELIGTKVLISPPEMIKICRDKSKTLQFFLDSGLKSPVIISNWIEYDAGYPAFIKPIHGSSSINAFKVENKEELRVYAAKIKDYIIQPFIEGREFTIDIFCDWSGKPISIVPRERLQIRAGEVLKTKIVMDETMIAEAKKLCKIFKICGPITVQVIRDNCTGDDYYIEINPRYGGGAPLSIKAGARSPEAVLKLIDNEMVNYFNDIADGAIYCRFDQSICLSEGKRQIKGVIFDLDDTLYPEKEYIKSGYRAVAEYLGNNKYFDQLWDYFEEGKPAIDELLNKLGREKEKNQVLFIYRNHRPIIHLYKGVLETITKLKKQSIKVGIITDGRPEGQRLKLSILGLEQIVDDIIITDELGGVQFRKPCDISFRIMLQKWRLPSDQVVYIGDNPTKDFQSPQQLGMKAIWFRNEDGIYFETLKLCGNEMNLYKVLKNYEK